MSIWRYANPAEFMRITRPAVGPLWIASAVLIALALGWGLFLTPEAEYFGSTVKIIFVHVPSAMLAINTYLLMVVASAIGFVRRHHVSFLIAKAAAPIGACFTLIAIITGAVWGQPMWGAWWVWDARLTAILVMFFFYLGYIALWAAIEEPEKAADLTAVLCFVGVIFALLSRYAVVEVFGVKVVDFQTQHQGASLSVNPGQRVADVYRTPLYLSILAFYVLFFALLISRTRMEIRTRRARAISLARA
ncbi:MAG: heme ABC transporter permease CcmC [Pseudomonadota bacterium]